MKEDAERTQKLSERSIGEAANGITKLRSSSKSNAAAIGWITSVALLLR